MYSDAVTHQPALVLGQGFRDAIRQCAGKGKNALRQIVGDGDTVGDLDQNTRNSVRNEKYCGPMAISKFALRVFLARYRRCARW
jgi:hypothetical protein